MAARKINAVAVDGYGFVLWQRFEVTSLATQKEALSAEIRKMEANVKKLNALGGKIEIVDCIDKADKQRKCVAIEPTPGISAYWGSPAKPYYVIRGY